MFKPLSLPMQLILTIVGVLIFGGYLPASVITFFYTISLLFKECLGFILPFMVFTFVLDGILSLKKGAPLVLITMLSCIFISNAFFATLTYGVARIVLPFISGCVDMGQLQTSNVIEPLLLWKLPPSFISSEYALLSAIVLGLFFSLVPLKQVTDVMHQSKKIIEKLLLNIFIPLLPVYVLGFLLKIQYEGMLVKLAHHYSGAFLLIVALQALFIFLFYYGASGFSIPTTWRFIINALPSYITAFGTMSSTVTVPVSILSAIKNTNNPSLANVAMPIMANVHLLGDSIGIPVLALVSLNLFMGVVPSFTLYLTFVFYFCTTMFAVSGIPGGAIIVMIPILINLFNFTPEMVSIVTALYLLLDPFETGGNVMGDGALVIILNNILKKFPSLQHDMVAEESVVDNI